ncbi:protein-L-isoaspartate O-methyltransferase family protein [Amaricoccus solimangrovi]|uniref:Protein-L-isoaspartate O-methyltransferase n=1 Tax=Amaricoccus solimangrovi TaxID=2589815 RepID=A0A501X0G3_9RHOB|nr:protein-L-isoaspartate O-methyltransferase [Amaricoccus solimangrovi]TPE53161.1 protein-L-isoaspartate O-methyltransferase [Amaricoccus solimangrovi]
MIDFAAAREAMVDCQVRPSDVTRYPIIEAMLAVPREEFLPEALRPVAYLGEHMPIAPGRVLLDPRVFAKMLDALNVGGSDLVLDIGCGYGYSSAVLARMAEAVIALEEIEDLAGRAETLLSAHSVDNAIVENGPLAAGVPGQGPYDAIIVEGGIEVLPEAITDQLKMGGRIVAIFLEGRGGQARLGIKMAHGIAWRRVFDASAPKLIGFETAKTFVF